MLYEIARTPKDPTNIGMSLTLKRVLKQLPVPQARVVLMQLMYSRPAQFSTWRQEHPGVHNAHSSAIGMPCAAHSELRALNIASGHGQHLE